VIVAEEISLIASSGWRSVDNASDPDSFITYLDEVTAPKRDDIPEVIRSLEISQRCSVLDVGSGTGKFLIEVARKVDGVRAVGIDVSQKMVTIATSRAQVAGVTVEFEVGDAERLRFPDESFDRVHCSLVLVHMEDPGAVVAEMARVLAPGGRIAILEPDDDMFRLDSSDAALSLRRQIAAGMQNPDVSRRLGDLVVDNGLDLLEASRVTLGEFDACDYVNDVARVGNIATEVAEQWRAEIETAHPSGLSTPTILFRVLATKPPVDDPIK
jgi:SAM-dependent methyltransferase